MSWQVADGIRAELTDHTGDLGTHRLLEIATATVKVPANDPRWTAK